VETRGAEKGEDLLGKGEKVPQRWGEVFANCGKSLRNAEDARMDSHGKGLLERSRNREASPTLIERWLKEALERRKERRGAACMPEKSACLRRVFLREKEERELLDPKNKRKKGRRHNEAPS